jgi:FtsP/CotA-like multicopper oxidase with cupredoxin domain
LQQPFAPQGSGRADAAPSPAAEGFLSFEAAPAKLQLAPPPAEQAAPCAYAGAIPGPLVRLRRGEELRLKFANKLADLTTLSFPGLRITALPLGDRNMILRHLSLGSWIAST